MLHIHTKYEVSFTIFMDMRVNQKNIYKNGCHLEAYVHFHIKDEVSLTNYMDRRVKNGKVPKWLLFENCKSD